MSRVLAERAAGAAYHDLYVQHRARVTRLARTLLRDPHEAEEVEQEVFLKLFHRLEIGPGQASWSGWIVRVTVNACRDRRRSGWWRLWRETSDELDEGRLRGAGASPEDAALAGEVRRRVWRACERLPARQREVFVLRQVEGFSTEETAEMLGLHPGSVKRHLYRAIVRLRAAIGGER